MCVFEYYFYDACGHRCIELLSHCAQRLWKAGMNGELWACPEYRYARNAMMVSPLIWEGVYGYCRYCQQKYVMFPFPFCRSLNDHHIPAYRSNPSMPCSTPIRPAFPPSRPSTRSSSSQRASHSPATYRSTLSSTSTPTLCKGPPVSTMYVPSPDFIYVQELSATVPFLLGISYQYNNPLVPEGKEILFPSKISKYDPSEEQKLTQWLVYGFVDGKIVSECVSNFSESGGMTDTDLDCVKTALLSGRVYNLWRQELEKRGMPWPSFLESVRAIGERMGLGSIEGMVWAEIRASSPERMSELSRPLLWS